jgi:DNA-binding Lrp family transcriptional regulator
VTGLDAQDRALLERMQTAFPLVPRPFAVLGEELELDEAQAQERVRLLRETGIIRQIGAIFDTRRLGYRSTLVAFHTGTDALETVAAKVSEHPGVSHNYARPHHYNLWFTLAVPPGQAVVAEIENMARATGTDDWLNLPALRVFKIRTQFELGGDRRPRDARAHSQKAQQSRAFSPADIPYVRALQRDLSLVSRPYAELAGLIGVSEAALLDKARELEAVGIMRRFGAVLRHRRVGYTANGMACWVVPESGIEDAGKLAAEFPQVSHCYQRPAYPPRWPYSLFTMIHGRTKDQVEDTVQQIAQQARLAQYEVLYSTREFKKERVRYFEEKT